jgi:VanZ family protein
MTTANACRHGAAWIAIAVVGVLSLMPKAYMIRTDLGGHVEHVLAYSGTAIIVATAYGARNWLGIAVGLIGYAGVLELLQNFSPGRTASVRDFACSASGVLLGLALFALVDRIAPLRRTGS